jgi:hypothetical protein
VKREKKSRTLRVVMFRTYPIMYRDDMAAAVRDGRKVETRRLNPDWMKLKKGDMLWRKRGRYGSAKQATLWTSVYANPRQERLQDITDAGLLAEGAPLYKEVRGKMARHLCRLLWYRQLWDELHQDPAEQWAANPVVVVIPNAVHKVPKFGEAH